jgi:hypothetical protein
MLPQSVPTVTPLHPVTVTVPNVVASRAMACNGLKPEAMTNMANEKRPIDDSPQKLEISFLLLRGNNADGRPHLAICSTRPVRPGGSDEG